MSAEVVQSQYDELKKVADRFARQAEAQKQMQQRVTRSMQTLQNGWQGKGSAAFFSEMNGKVLPVMKRMENALLQAQRTTNEIQQIIKTAEEDAAKPFSGNHTPRNAEVSGASSMAAASTLGSIALLILGNISKGIAADSLVAQRYVLRALTPNIATGNSTVAMLMDMAKGKPGKGLPLIRFDGPHGGTPFPHINLNPKLTGFKDPHLPISPRLLSAAGTGAKILEGARKVALPLALTIDVFRLGAAYHSDGNHIGANTKQTVGSVAGGWGGAWAGAVAGAEGGALIGGAIGTIVPGVGNAVGAGVGGFLGGLGGGIVGGLSGSWIGEKLGGLF